MKKNPIRSRFNLIEVTMAIAVVGIGIAGVMALFPPAIEANKAANFQNFTGPVVNNVAAYLDYMLKKDWNTFSGKLKEKGSATTPPQETSFGSWKPLEISGIFQVQNKDDLLGIRSQDGSIAAHVRIWKDNGNMNKAYFDGTEITLSDSSRIRVVIELSWPIAQAYASREKQEFVYEFNKPGN